MSKVQHLFTKNDPWGGTLPQGIEVNQRIKKSLGMWGSDSQISHHYPRGKAFWKLWRLQLREN